MDEQNGDRVGDALDRIEGRLMRLELRLERLERLQGVESMFQPESGAPESLPLTPPPIPPSPPATPPPYIPPRPSTPAPVPIFDVPVLVEPPVTSPVEGDDFEFKLGKIGLLRGGAVIFVIGILYLVALAASRHAISPLMQFVGEQVLCAAFIVVGFIKRNEREEFGQLMTGIGSAGLYLSFAGGYVYKHLYPDSAMVGLFMALGLANLGYAYWRTSRSFFALGMLGGLVAAMLPMHSYNAPLSVVLHFAILVPCVVVVVRRSWLDMTVWLWIASLLALLPVYTYANHLWELRAGALYLDSVLCVGAYALIFRTWSFDTKGYFSAIAACIGGVGAVAIEGCKNGSLHVLLYAAALAGLAFAVRKRSRQGEILLVSSVAIATTLAPMGYSPVVAGTIFAVVAGGLTVATIRLRHWSTIALAAFDIVLGTFAVEVMGQTLRVHIPPAQEQTVLGLLLVVLAALGVVASKRGVPKEWAAVVASLGCLGLFERIGGLVESSTHHALPPDVAGFYTTVIAVFAMGLVAWRSRILALVQVTVGVAGVILTLLMMDFYSVMYGEAPMVAHLIPYELGMDATLIGLTCFLIALVKRGAASEKLELIFPVGLSLCAGSFLTRLGYISAPGYIHVAQETGGIFGALIWAYASVVIANRWKANAYLVGTGIAVLISLNAETDFSVPLSAHSLPTYQGLILTALGGAVFLLGRAVERTVSYPRRMLVLLATGLVGVYIFGRLAMVELVPLGFTLTGALATGGLVGVGFFAFLNSRKPLVESVAASWASLALTAVTILPWSYLVRDQVPELVRYEHGSRHEAPILLLLLAATLLVGRVTWNLSKEKAPVLGACVMLEWTTYTRFLTHVLRHTSLGGNAVVSIAWTSFAALAIAIGFRYRYQPIRYWSLFIFLLTVIKVFAIDLAFVDAAVRVVILMFLGVTMVGGGYAYLRLNQPKVDSIEEGSSP